MLSINLNKRLHWPAQTSPPPLTHKKRGEDKRSLLARAKSFYFFDFDDNILFLPTPIIIFKKDTGEEKYLSSSQWAKHHDTIGKQGPFKDYFLEYNDQTGSFRYFRDQKLNFMDKVVRKQQFFISDIEKALKLSNRHWQAPSWNFFYHATSKQRPISIITARGHQRETLKKGIQLLIQKGHLPCPPNYLSLYPVANPQIRTRELGDLNLTQSIAQLKKQALFESVKKAIELYGHNPYHRFGMSDDDPKNIELITEEMKNLKRLYPEMGFFIIQTLKDNSIKTEVLPH